ncbi:fibronectin type III domain protein [Actinidia rufa]|uniref:Fibronectin type III domain protein n=1 Tax=Actinidia rufa TaxID=165716 RepID=A0A7J0H5K5_9ERIC|nr:fibronectin type III domain protein [Actinidia rufa]
MVILVKEENPSPDGVCGGESSQTHLPNPIYEKNQENPDEKIDFPEMGIDFSREFEMGCDDFESKPSKTGDYVSLNLILSHLCENPKLVFPQNERNLRNSFEKVVCEYQNQENNGLVKRDLLRWKEVNVNTSKRQVVEYEEIDGDNKEKKPKLETLNLNTSKRQVVEYEEIDGDNKEKKPKLETLNLSLAFFIIVFMFPPVFLTIQVPRLPAMILLKTMNIRWGVVGETVSRFGMVGRELMVRLIVNLGRLEMGLQCKITVVEVFHRCKSLSPSRPSQGIQELPDEALEPMKKYLKKLIATPERKEELVNLQNKLEGRSYLNKETLLTTSIKHLEILVSVKTGLGSFLSGENCIPTTELVEIFLLERCRNINCKRVCCPLMTVTA